MSEDKQHTLGLSEREAAFFQAYAELSKQFADIAYSFGLWRLHSHFSLSADEVLHETSNIMQRKST